MATVTRQTVDLSAFPDLVVIYLGMRVNAWVGLKTLFGFGPRIKKSVDQKPEGLLLHENFILSLAPPHLGDASVLARLRHARGVDSFAPASRVVA